MRAERPKYAIASNVDDISMKFQWNMNEVWMKYEWNMNEIWMKYLENLSLDEPIGSPEGGVFLT